MKKITKRMRTNDVAFTFRMGSGFAGDVNRSHPASVEANAINVANPPQFAGNPVFVNTATNDVRQGLGTDVAGAIYGVAVRSNPVQAGSSSGQFGAQGFGASALPTHGIVDVLRLGYIIVSIPPGQVVTKGGAVYMWIAASAGLHTLGQFEGVAAGASTVLISNAKFVGPADAAGYAEIYVA
jgi:hypothetical protein